MPARINLGWKNEMIDSMNKHLSTEGAEPFIPVLISFNKAAQWLIVNMSEKGLKPKVENLGAGVKRISVESFCCPTCGGQR